MLHPPLIQHKHHFSCTNTSQYCRTFYCNSRYEQ